DSTIFPGLTGKQLCDSLRARYTANTNLGYNTAKDTLFAHIDCHNDTLRCIYGGFKIWMDPATSDPSQYAEARNINCEHSWVQSRGASNYPQQSDMHHLFPSYDVINSARSSYPFNEIPDSETERWYVNNTNQTNIPSSNIDDYTEIDFGSTAWNGRCEIREINKGNIARAQYYFFTIWRTTYLATDPDSVWWMSEKDDMYQWHCVDPADQAEITRTRRIALRQENKPNPFVLDSTLIRRAYFPNMGVEGGPGALASGARLLGNVPNPFQGSTVILYSLPGPGRAEVVIYNVLGLEVARLAASSSGQGERSIAWNARSSGGQPQPPGIYFYQLKVGGVPAATRRMLLVR
ncbi:MAG TPA: hypothetical protein DDW31_04465, partial [candidate division Zixibacteria bacterium]|nr:hypothetical protein [candidate division Zixibacteria bacterium]